MKAILLKDVVKNEGTKHETVFSKGTIIEVFHNPQIDSTSVYVPYQLKGKAYKHWFYVVTLPTSPDTTEVKIIDTEGYDLEKAIETVVEVNARKLKNEIALLREAFKVDK